MKKAFLNWSSGKDAAFALYKIQQEKEFKVEKLVTTLTAESDKVSMHQLPRALLEQQAKNIGIQLHLIKLKENLSMKAYSEIMKNEISGLSKQGFYYSIFGDIFLEDLREYRDNQLKGSGISAEYPLWKMDTKKLISQFIEAGFKAIAICTNAGLLNKSFCGREIDRSFIQDLPKGIDPCGENGEFHTFVYNGPIFKKPVKFKKGRISEKVFSTDKKNTWDSRFYYYNLIPG